MFRSPSTRSHWTHQIRLGMSSILCGKTIQNHSKKKRLVIDYQPLNCFLQDDKFPLPKVQSLFVHLHDAKVFSKFDLKVGFWQLGIDPSDRHKTIFCIPNGHYQWTVMPFGLKVAPSLFQKAMTKIFEPILRHTLVYIDDILLFSKDHVTHQKLLDHFLALVESHGIMLSEKKSTLGHSVIELHFLVEHLTKKQI